MGTTNGRRLAEKAGLLTLGLALTGAFYTLGSRDVLAAPGPAPVPVCTDCDCKMAYAWKMPSDSYASGFQTQGLTPQKILTGLALQVKMCPDPPQVCYNATKVDRYEYQNPATPCSDNINSRRAMEADVTGAGTRVAVDLNHSTCIAQNANCPPLP